MSKPSKDPSIEHEPQATEERFEVDPSERTGATPSPPTQEQRVDHSVWDEPALSVELAGEPPAGGLDYAGWLAQGRARTSVTFTWMLTLAATLLAGPLAVVGALFRGGDTAMQMLKLTVLGPLVEEMLKIALPLIVVERRAFWFSSPLQIIVAAVGGGLAFAVVENLLYLHVYTCKPSSLLVAWRWSVCVALHTGCSLLAGLGVARVWRRVWQTYRRPELGQAAPFIIAAVVIHGLYNLGAAILSIVDARF